MSTSTPRKRAPRARSTQQRDMPATADMTPPPVKDEPAEKPNATPAAAAAAGAPVGENLLRPGGGSPGLAEQQAEKAAVAMLRQPGERELFDASTGAAPDPDSMFAQVGFSGTVFESRVRLMERMWVDSMSVIERLVLPAGRQVSGAAAAQIVAAVRSQTGG